MKSRKKVMSENKDISEKCAMEMKRYWQVIENFPGEDRNNEIFKILKVSK